jgi:NAD(P)H dehydrogenase (quinone)
LPKIAITGATGQLGRLVAAALLQRGPASDLVALVRSPEKAADVSSQGVEVRQADYERPETLLTALQRVERLLLISSSEVGKRVAQHRAVIEAAKAAGVGFLAYTSILHADTSPIGLAEEHRQTEAALKASGIPFATLRNGWYTENYLGAIAPAVAHGVVLGASGDGRIAAATRADFAEAAAAVLTTATPAIYELGGDDPFTMAEFAAEIARQAGKPVTFQNMPEADYRAALLGAGLPPFLADLVSQSSACAARGALNDESHTLSRLIARPTTPLANVIASGLKA